MSDRELSAMKERMQERTRMLQQCRRAHTATMNRLSDLTRAVYAVIDARRPVELWPAIANLKRVVERQAR